MKPTFQCTLATLCLVLLSTAHAQETTEGNPARSLRGQTDAKTGLEARQWLHEQANGIHRGDVEAYRAESAGKAYRAYMDSIGSKEQKAPTSQVQTIKTN
ncbi:hypothetical protein NQT62_00585 [Limnobacter humi]|uniref:DUF4148 domain-containing protein n=1 Tax=Limnobacter humi TaxID=1778671 RepID=A0ABT1WBP0_9BURK|nr:hypothetical protein [Limnobacter humi]MCQ8894934.1 hypothetical protein [Limnobacter humi]